MFLEKIFRKKKTQKRTLYDVRLHRGRTLDTFSNRVVNLSRPFLTRYPVIAVGILLLFVISMFAWQKLFTRAEATDFYPATCLGTWQNPQHAQGTPETFGKTDIEFTEENSAVHSASSSDIYCGSFISEDYETRGNLQNVGLTLVWRVGELASSSDGASEEILEIQEESQPSEEPTSLMRPMHSLASYFMHQAFAQESAPESTEPIAPVEIPSPAEEPPPVTATPTEPPPIEEPAPAPAEDELPASLTNGEETEVINDEGRTSSSGEEQANEPVQDEASTSSETEMLPEVPVIETPPDDHFLKVSYSTDGELWIEIERVNSENWSHFTQTVPIQSWEELRNLQIKIESIETSLEVVPPVYLDGMLIEAHYEIPPAVAFIPQIAGIIGIPENQNSENTVAAEKSQEEKPKVKIFDEAAKHSCKVTPFSQQIKKGESAEYFVKLVPSGEEVNFALLTGDLPSGVSGSFDPETGAGSSTAQLTLQSATSSEKGSYDIIIIHREIDKEMQILANFCQLNLIIE